MPIVSMDREPLRPPRMLEYWNQKKDAVFRNSRHIALLDERKKAEALSYISKNVKSQAGDLTDRDIVAFAFVMADDLYKAANRDIIIVDSMLFRYLEASALTFSKILSERGFIIHYLVDNTFEKSLTGMQRPLELYPGWFRSSGWTYICPQFVALQMMKEKGYGTSEYFYLLPEYIESARYLANRFIRRCHEEKRHYIFLDTEWTPRSFEISLSVERDPGVITIMRKDPPVPGSKCSVSCSDARGESLL